ncbi:MAG: hypothetical protein VX505_08870 [Chloroflexota bacterium]|nr:hypothetical protein [Dehalococcoidia bacterium]MEE3014263.1 hypothetical protein [Chloroflexota bacterium]GIS94166.1 MAG: hypothetical protein CM1200mP22_14030 [Dehalococcoidia bacterium]
MRLSNPDETCLPTTTWFLYSEVQEKPLGRIYLMSIPKVKDQVEGGQGNQFGEIVRAEELRATCAIRRFKVILRLHS